MSTTATRERPILFSSPMVRAVLEGRKTQTRRVVKADRYRHQRMNQGVARPSSGHLIYRQHETWGPSAWDDSSVRDPIAVCPYGQPGDRLWVRETWWQPPAITPRMLREGADTWPKIGYVVDDDGQLELLGWRKRAAIYLSRSDSRITLEITDVRVQRLQDISLEDVLAEGIKEVTEGPHANQYWREETGLEFADLWDFINGKKPGCSWDDDPWVWALSFRHIENGGKV